MRRALFLFAELDDHHVEWLTEAGRAERIDEGTVLVKEGAAIEGLYVLLAGKLAVTAGSEGKRVGILRKGEIVGELSYLDARPPSATVSAMEDSIVFKISRDRLGRKIAEDDSFGVRFYRALGVFLADRLRGLVGALALSSANVAEADDDGDSSDDAIDLDLLDGVDRAAARFDEFVRKLTAA